MVETPVACTTIIQQYLVGPIVLGDSGNSKQNENGVTTGRAAVPLQMTGKQGPVEKNWSPFEYNGHLYASRFLFPKHQVVQIDTKTGASTPIDQHGTESAVLNVRFVFLVVVRSCCLLLLSWWW